MTHIQEISEKEKIRIASDFLLHAPPGEFNEVFNDVRLLLNNDTLLKDGCANAFVQYNKDQMMPVKIDGSKHQALVTPLNELPNGRFFDPRTKLAFHYDHLRKESSDFQPWESDNKAESWRLALQSAVDAYVENHYKVGVASVFGSTDPSSGHVCLTVCIESHKFEPKNFSNGRWRSQWSIVLADKTAELKGIIKVQVHYYEDGNVQLVSSKDVSRKINVTTDSATAKEIVNVITEEETNYQTGVCENYQQMSDTTFKALRRQLPVTRTKLDWSKIAAYKVGSELKPIG